MKYGQQESPQPINFYVNSIQNKVDWNTSLQSERKNNETNEQTNKLENNDKTVSLWNKNQKPWNDVHFIFDLASSAVIG